MGGFLHVLSHLLQSKHHLHIARSSIGRCIQVLTGTQYIKCVFIHQQHNFYQNIRQKKWLLG